MWQLPRPSHLSPPIPGKASREERVGPRSPRRKCGDALFFQQVTNFPPTTNNPPGGGREGGGKGGRPMHAGKRSFLRPLHPRTGAFFSGGASFTPCISAFVVFFAPVAAKHVGCGGSSFPCGGGGLSHPRSRPGPRRLPPLLQPRRLATSLPLPGARPRNRRRRRRRRWWWRQRRRRRRRVSRSICRSRRRLSSFSASSPSRGGRLRGFLSPLPRRSHFRHNRRRCRARWSRSR